MFTIHTREIDDREYRASLERDTGLSAQNESDGYYEGYADFLATPAFRVDRDSILFVDGSRVLIDA